MSNRSFALVLCIFAFLTGANNFIGSLLLPEIASKYLLPLSVASYFVTAQMISYGGLQIIYGVICSYYGRLRLLKILTVGFLIAILGCGLAPSFNSLIFFRFLVGFFAAGNIPLSLALIGDLFQGEEQGRYLGLFMACVGLGQGVSSLAGGYLIEFFDFRSIFIVLTGITLIGVILLFRAENKLPVRKIDPQEVVHQLKTVFTSKYCSIVYIPSFMVGFFYFTFVNLLGSYLTKVFFLPSRMIGLIMMYYALACLAGSYLLPILSRRIGPIDLLKRVSIIMCISVLLLAYFPNLVVTLSCLSILGIVFIIQQTSTITLSFKITSQYKGLPNAVIGILLFGGGALGTAVFVPILEQYNFKILYIILALGILCQFFVLEWWQKKYKEEVAAVN